MYTYTYTHRVSSAVGGYDQNCPHILQGGAELGVPILIAGLEEDKVAYTCGDLQIGDAILLVNGECLQVLSLGMGRRV